jgi:hypothetical protein
MPRIRRSPGASARAASTVPTDDTHGTNVARELHRRRIGAARSEPLDCGHRDPWTCRHYDAPESPERNADGYYATAQRLLAAGLLPAPNLPAMRLMWRRDVEQRELARYIAERWGVAA